VDILQHNKSAWNGYVASARNEWTVPVTSEVIARARSGDWKIVLTPTVPVPRSWFPKLHRAKVLGLASGGGQQCPILAAAGADVTSLDNSPAQLAQDLLVADRDGLTLRTVEGDMGDLSVFQEETFDLIVHPVSNVFAPAIRTVWKEASRVLKKGGTLLAGFMNPVFLALDRELEAKGVVQFKHKIPYSDVTSLSASELQVFVGAGDALEFGHTLADQIGGQVDAGLAITGFYEDDWGNDKTPLSKYMNSFIATRAVKL